MARSDEHDNNNAADESRYGDELLRANWNPVIELLQWSCERTVEMTQSAPADVTDDEAAAFLGRVYNAGT
jgi:hypothetical protein